MPASDLASTLARLDPSASPWEIRVYRGPGRWPVFAASRDRARAAAIAARLAAAHSSTAAIFPAGVCPPFVLSEEPPARAPALPRTFPPRPSSRGTFRDSPPTPLPGDRARVIPDPRPLLDLEPAELVARVLDYLHRRARGGLRVVRRTRNRAARLFAGQKPLPF